jgi:hypothetical protein
LWHIDPLLDNDRETNNETMTVARQRPARNNESTVGNDVLYVVRSETISRDRQSFIIIIINFNCKLVLTDGSGTTIRHNTQVTHITQNNTPHSNKTTQTIRDTLHTMNTM